jgi:hypothetical protein
MDIVHSLSIRLGGDGLRLVIVNVYRPLSPGFEKPIRSSSSEVSFTQSTGSSPGLSSEHAETRDVMARTTKLGRMGHLRG